jgi:hypothetical protein
MEGTTENSEEVAPGGFVFMAIRAFPGTMPDQT